MIRRYLPAMLLALFLYPVAIAHCGMLQLNARIEDFRIDSTDKLGELYTLRGVHIDNKNTDATEGVQIFINEIRGNVFLVNNVLDITFFYDLHRGYDDKNVVAEYMTNRLREINENIRYNVRKLDNLAGLLHKRGQETLVEQFMEYKVRLMDVSESVRMIRDLILEDVTEQGEEARQ